jgi:hypothetical protein
MNAINKESILNKTHYGLRIYSHILRLYYPNQVVIRLSGRDCGLCRNPFNSHKETLHIYIHKSDPQDATSEEYALHEDTTNAIPAGDAFDFAQLHYQQQGEELYNTLNKALYLHIGEEQNPYRSRNTTIEPPSPPLPAGSVRRTPRFSFFKAPITNTKPHKTVTLLQVYNAIRGAHYRERTQQLRSITDPAQARRYKSLHFDYCSFSGIFTPRSDQAMIEHSGLLCIDFDHIKNIQQLRARLLRDTYFETQLLFISPSGNGLKWIIPINTASYPHRDYFTAIANYLKQIHCVEADKSGRDPSRACFLPHDPQAYIHPIHLNRS